MPVWRNPGRYSGPVLIPILGLVILNEVKDLLFSRPGNEDHEIDNPVAPPFAVFEGWNMNWRWPVQPGFSLIGDVDAGTALSITTSCFLDGPPSARHNGSPQLRRWHPPLLL
jgi:hypothetical protein